jgi:neurotrimin
LYLFLENAHTTYDESISRQPQFLKVPTTVSVIEGSTVILSCRIDNLAERMVFWIRNNDLQILTAGLVTFTADKRFKVNLENAVDATDWSLLITNVKMEDQGQYECQINTEPKMKLNINLMVKGENFSIYYS